jgi:hypothetical protein
MLRATHYTTAAISLTHTTTRSVVDSHRNGGRSTNDGNENRNGDAEGRGNGSGSGGGVGAAAGIVVCPAAAAHRRHRPSDEGNDDHDRVFAPRREPQWEGDNTVVLENAGGIDVRIGRRRPVHGRMRDDEKNRRDDGRNRVPRPRRCDRRSPHCRHQGGWIDVHIFPGGGTSSPPPAASGRKRVTMPSFLKSTRAEGGPYVPSPTSVPRPVLPPPSHPPSPNDDDAVVVVVPSVSECASTKTVAAAEEIMPLIPAAAIPVVAIGVDKFTSAPPQSRAWTYQGNAKSHAHSSPPSTTSQSSHKSRGGGSTDEVWEQIEQCQHCRRSILARRPPPVQTQHDRAKVAPAPHPQARHCPVFFARCDGGLDAAGLSRGSKTTISHGEIR